jgi:peptidoglycan/LPS O-acetylase OafA/YrhL
MGLMFGGLVSMFLSARCDFGIADTNIFSRLGKYTYGLYLYHVIIINLLIVLFRRAGRSVERFPDGLLLVVFALGVSIVVSALIPLFRKAFPRTETVFLSTTCRLAFVARDVVGSKHGELVWSERSRWRHLLHEGTRTVWQVSP